MWKDIKNEMETELRKELNFNIKLEEPKIKGAGDLAFSVFEIAKNKQKNPSDLAKEISCELSKLRFFFIKQIAAIGPYVNIWIDWQKVAKSLFNEVNEEYLKKEKNKVVVIDFSSPNPAHPFHMGTLRSTFIGESLARILEWYGYNVKRVCYINDMGKQAMTLLLGYTLYAKDKTPNKKPDVWLGEIYKKISLEVEENSDLEEQVFRLMKLYEEQDKNTFETGKKIFKWCLEGFNENWKIFDIKFDEIIFESSFIKDSKNLINELEKNKMLEDVDNAKLLKLEPKLPNTIIVRKDGTGLYLLRDLAFALWKFKKFKPVKNIYVVGEDQKLHFQQLFYTLKKLGYSDFSNNCYHIGYSLVLFEGQKMSSRKGTAVLWDDVFKEGVDKALNEIEKRWPDLDEKEIIERAEKISLAAIKYFILKYSPEKSINFTWENALRFEGDTGPYLQYTYARANSILEKSKEKIEKIDFDTSILTEENEIKLIKQISKFSSALHDSVINISPHILANYAFELANEFNSFYEKIPVLKAEKNERLLRLKLIDCTVKILKICLNLLGIPIIEKM
ncbi:MAG: arginine--tRNA ligase [Candidatus Aenigmatarchaeota archaeon]